MISIQHHKIIAIHQPNFFPWLGYFSKIKQADAFVFLDNVDISLHNSNAITHRTRINYFGKPMWLSVPMEKTETKKIQFLKIRENEPWREKQTQIITQAYSNAPFFNEIFPIFKEWLNYDEKSLSKFNAYIIKEVSKFLAIKTEFYFASELGINENDSTLRLIEICKKLNGTIYLSGLGGKKYHNEALFAENQIEVKYTTFSPKEYDHHSVYIQGLSVLDALLECGKNTRNLL